MISSSRSLRSLLVLASLAVAAAASIVWAPIAVAGQAVYQVWRRARDWVFDLVVDVHRQLRHALPQPPAALRVQLASLARWGRDRVERALITPRWRMCPST
jgi:hypothetical protein